ncbi:hypothetical protein [Natronomonas gomsonensis]|uniref:hypothetical protein n=1 Tax=Natronomonas gomsonensis TaxID=1046043 RepID=UPI0015BA8463|nr:hypothetical protein [Natronomonas gomsonensis]
MNAKQKKMVAAGGVGVISLGGGYLLLKGDSAEQAAEEAPAPVPEQATEAAGSLREALEGTRLTARDGVLYDDTESVEPDSDENVSFVGVGEALDIDGEELAENYAPDTEGDTEAPSGGVLADPGDSQEWGDAPEAEDDDLSERAAESNLSDRMKASFDRLANYDDPSQL